MDSHKEVAQERTAETSAPPAVVVVVLLAPAGELLQPLLKMLLILSRCRLHLPLANGASDFVSYLQLLDMDSHN